MQTGMALTISSSMPDLMYGMDEDNCPFCLKLPTLRQKEPSAAYLAGGSEAPSPSICVLTRKQSAGTSTERHQAGAFQTA